MIFKLNSFNSDNFSDNTIQNVFNAIFHNDKVYKNHLTKALCIDKFTFKSKMFAFNIYNAKNGKIIDAVLDRTTYNLDKYFAHYTKDARKNVRFVVMDMYSP